LVNAPRRTAACDTLCGQPTPEEGFTATNLVSQIAETLAPPIISRIASSLGLDQSSTQKAISAGVPGILAALISLVSKPQGATKLNDVVAKQQPGVLSNLASVIGESGQKAFIDKRASALNSLLGGTTVSALTSALGRYAGIGEGGSKSLLGLLGPAVLGILGQQQRDRGLDASGLARLLTSQKDSVVAALPSGFSKYLDEARILDDVTATARHASREHPSRAPVDAVLVIAERLMSTTLGKPKVHDPWRVNHRRRHHADRRDFVTLFVI
jgi:hypothetical protein